MNAIDNPVFDKAAALERMAFDAQLFGEMIELIREDGPRRMEELRSHLAAGDLPGVRHAAHSLKGLTANFSAGRAMRAAAEVEKLAKAGDPEGRLPAAVPELHEALSELLAELALHLLPAVQTDHRTLRRDSATHHSAR